MASYGACSLHPYVPSKTLMETFEMPSTFRRCAAPFPRGAMRSSEKTQRARRARTAA